MNKRATIALTMILTIGMALAPSKEARHPLSQVHPIDESLNMSNKSVFNISEIRLESGLEIDNHAIQNGDVDILRYDTTNNEWDLPGSGTNNLNLNGNALKKVGAVYGVSGTQCGDDEFLAGNGTCKPDSEGSSPTENDIEADIFDTSDNDKGDLGLNGNQIVDQTGPINLAGGKVNISGGNLLLNNNSLSDVGSPSDPFDAVNKQYVDTNDDTTPDNQDLSQVLSLGNSTGSYDIDLNGNAIETGGGTATIYDTANNQDIARFKEGGNVEIPNGNLNLSDNRASGLEALGFYNDSSQILFYADAGGQFEIRDISKGKDALRINSKNVEIPNGDLNLSENLTVYGYKGVKVKGGLLDIEPSGSKGIDLSGTLDMNGNSFYNPSSLTTRSTFVIQQPGGKNIASFSENGPVKFSNPVTNEDILKLNSSTGSNVKIPNGDLTISGSSSSDSPVIKLNNESGKTLHQIYADRSQGDKLVIDTVAGNTATDKITVKDADLQLKNSNLSLKGDALKEVGAVYDDSGTQCGKDQFLNGKGNCKSDSTGSSNGPTYIINEDFDDGSASGWTIDSAACSSSGITSNPETKGDSPAIDPKPVNTNVLQVVGDDVHVSPSVDATSYSSLELKVYISSASMDDSTEDSQIQVYDGSSWVTVANSHNHPETGTYPKYFERDLSPYINSNFKIRFRLAGSNGCGDYGTIDEVRVVAAP